MIVLKPGVQARVLSSQALLAMMVVDGIYGSFGNPKTVITSIGDGKHSVRSKHWTGDAFDVRTRDILHRQEIQRQIQEALGGDWDVVLEATHLHVEYDPKGPPRTLPEIVEA